MAKETVPYTLRSKCPWGTIFSDWPGFK